MYFANYFLITQVALIYWWVIAGGAYSLSRFLIVNKATNSTNSTSSDPLTSCSARGCGTCLNVTSTGGIIQSQNFPNDYGSNFSCVYNIGVAGGKKIELQFTTFVVQKRVDVLIVNDGSGPGQLNSVNLNGYLVLPTLTSLSNQMTVEFISFGGTRQTLPINTVPSWRAIYTVK